MKTGSKVAAGVLVVGAAVGLGSVVAGASSLTGESDGNEVPITGDALSQASKVALEHTGEGRVTETEEGDEDSYYEVEVTLDSGGEVDVQLDRDFAVVGSEAENGRDSD